MRIATSQCLRLRLTAIGATADKRIVAVIRTATRRAGGMMVAGDVVAFAMVFTVLAWPVARFAAHQAKV